MNQYLISAYSYISGAVREVVPQSELAGRVTALVADESIYKATWELIP